MRTAGCAEGQWGLERGGTAIAVAGNGLSSIHGDLATLAIEDPHFRHLRCTFRTDPCRKRMAGGLGVGDRPFTRRLIMTRGERERADSPAPFVNSSTCSRCSNPDSWSSVAFLVKENLDWQRSRN